MNGGDLLSFPLRFFSSSSSFSKASCAILSLGCILAESVSGRYTMGQARHWMLTERKHSLSSHLQALPNPSYNDSWEEQAFAEDASGPLGGCVWPPRSYSCNFCRREFRSAQALGGHMNVHRRDRARLKQSPSPQNEILHHVPPNYQNHVQNPFTSLGFQHTSRVCALIYDRCPNSDPAIVSSPSSPSRVSVLPNQVNCSEQIWLPPYSSSIVQEHHNRPRNSSPPSWSNLFANKCYQISDPNKDKNSSILESGCRAKGDYVKTDVSVSLNLVVRGTCPTVSDGKEEANSYKRRRTDSSSFPFFLKPSSVIRQHIQPEVIELCPSSLEDLDLELRLGDRFKEKKNIIAEARCLM